MMDLKVGSLSSSCDTIETKIHFTIFFLVKLDVLRCNRRDIMETCTSVLNYVNSSGICELLATPVDAYTKALDQIEPRPLCPLKKGSFFLHRLPTDDSLLKCVTLIIGWPIIRKVLK